MKIVFKSHTNTSEEIELGHKVGFSTIKGIDAISLSANLNGFTPATAVLRHLGYEKDKFKHIEEQCRADGTVELYKEYKPNLIFIPPTRGISGKHKSMEYFIAKTLQICNYENYKTLHFTHFGFVNGEFQHLDIFKIFSVILNPLIYTTLDVFYWEIDSRYLNDLMLCYQHINSDCFRNNSGKPEVIHSPEFEYVDYISNSDGSYWKQLQRKRNTTDSSTNRNTF